MFILALYGSDIALFVVLLLVLALLVVDLEVAELVGVLYDSGHKFEKTLQRKELRVEDPSSDLAQLPHELNVTKNRLSNKESKR
jgi:hypothetical protein